MLSCAGSNDAADVAASKAEGRLRMDMPKPATIADGLQGRMGDLTWPVIRDKTDAVIMVRFAWRVALLHMNVLDRRADLASHTLVTQILGLCGAWTIVLLDSEYNSAQAPTACALLGA